MLFLPLTAAIPISSLRSLWDVIAAAICLHRIVTQTGKGLPRKYVLMLVGATVGTLFAALLRGDSVTSALPSLMSLATIMGTALFIYDAHKVGRGSLPIVCLSVGLLIHLLLLSPTVGANPWKYGVGLQVSITLLALFTKRSNAALSAALCLVLATVSLATGSRELAAFVTLPIIALLAGKALRRTHKSSRIPTLLMLAVVLISNIYLLIGALSQSSIAEPARERFLAQSDINDNPLLAGRIEPPISIAAVLEQPVLGLGPSAPPTRELISDAVSVAETLGYHHPTSLIAWWVQDDQIYTHSIMMSTWVSGGIFVAIPLFCILIHLARSSFRAVVASAVASPLAVFLFGQLSWDILFSPETFGSYALIGLALGMSMIPSTREKNLSSSITRPTNL